MTKYISIADSNILNENKFYQYRDGTSDRIDTSLPHFSKCQRKIGCHINFFFCPVTKFSSPYSKKIQKIYGEENSIARSIASCITRTKYGSSFASHSIRRHCERERVSENECNTSSPPPPPLLTEILTNNKSFFIELESLTWSSMS